MDSLLKEPHFQFSVINYQFVLCVGRSVLRRALKEEISEVVGFELDDPDLQNATVTDVEVSPDTRDAKVYVLVIGARTEINRQ